MGLQYPTSGYGSVPEYQVSGLPHVTSSVVTTSPLRIDFPTVSRNLTFAVTGSGSGPLRVGYTFNGVNIANYFIVDPGARIDFPVRVKQVFVRADSGTSSFSMCAALTAIPTSSAPFLSASSPASGTILPWPGVG